MKSAEFMAMRSAVNWQEKWYLQHAQAYDAFLNHPTSQQPAPHIPLSQKRTHIPPFLLVLQLLPVDVGVLIPAAVRAQSSGIAADPLLGSIQPEAGHEVRANLVFSSACAMLHWVTFIRWLISVATKFPSL